ncbi:2-hydroxychromene-2-carboxylate isomerase [Caulobacter mirabilis]|uniref:2-hydroxychromene-2-carboxylate isomerase n=1 Tax=Caulobacter mirabilis TaxID=69666 RepID=A0A2D2ASF5_9CAUL|nr:DsbA family protein [Caulobacter mirabilis]ATQ40913.1 disulfide bond formation protein DsbA [Caulobacter mirabilis]
MTPSVDVFWSFRSPYSYLATPQLVRLREDFDLQIVVRPVLPIAVRIDGFFKRVNPLWPPYLARDIYRLGQMQGVPIRWPRPDPIVMDIASGEVPADQPYIHRLTRLGQAAAEAGRGLEYVAEVGAVIWSGAVDDWHLGDHLARAAERAGLDPGALERAAASEADRLDAQIAANQQALESAGHWGVPTMVFDGEPFFGQDRLDVLRWRLEQRGVSKRRSEAIQAH